MQRSTATSPRGFTIVELVVVIIVLGILAAIALPRFVAISSEARIAALESIAGSMRSTIAMVQLKARLAGITPLATNPGAGQAEMMVETEMGTSELHFSNLCPESSAEMGDALDMLDYMWVNMTPELTSTTDNQFTRIGYEITNSLVSGCYVVYDSFVPVDCTVTVVDTDC